MATLSRSGVFCCVFTVYVLIAGCATSSGGSNNTTRTDEPAQDEPAGDNSDPLEGFNRAMFTFNDKMDVYFLKPVAKGYRAVLPSVVRTGVSNFFNNLGEPGVMLVLL